MRILLIKKGGKRQIFDCIDPKTQSNERQLFIGRNFKKRQDRRSCRSRTADIRSRSHKGVDCSRSRIRRAGGQERIAGQKWLHPPESLPG